MEQMSMDVDITATTDLKRIRIALEQELADAEFIKNLSIVENKDGSISIKAKSILAAKIKLKKNSSYIEIKPKYEKNFSSFEIMRPSNNWSRVKISGINDVLSSVKPLGIVYIEELSELGGEPFGCCHRYTACSDALKCLHPNFLTSLACAYKKNLEAGRIFYGRNKTI